LANIKSAQKRILTNEKRRAKNAGIKTSVRTEAKKVLKTLESEKPEEKNLIEQAFKNFVKRIDRISGKKIIHWKTAARKKSRIAKKVNAALKQA
jgi:small subunit ribosomal protein S20